MAPAARLLPDAPEVQALYEQASEAVQTELSSGAVSRRAPR
jgi:hypothetical protein